MGLVEIMAANSSVSSELQNLKFLGKHSARSLSSYYVIQLIDHFTHDRPNGAHCLVLELLGPTVDKVLAYYCLDHDELDPETMLRIFKQLLKAVNSTYTASVCHGVECVFALHFSMLLTHSIKYQRPEYRV
jgi:serine/threonine-protein kinase SRPK3